jgi:chromosome segregation ATPase
MKNSKVLVLALVMAFSSAMPLAVSANENLERQLAKAKFLLKSLQKENQSLKAERAQMTADLADAQSDLEALTEDKKSLERQLAEANADKADLGDRLDVSEARRAAAMERIDLLTEKLREHVDVLKRTVAQRNNLELDLDDMTAAKEDCEFKNRKLYQANVEMMQRYESKGMDDAMAQRNTITGLKQAKIENILEEYRRKIDEFEVADSNE